MALLGTFLPWYAFDVLVPGRRFIEAFAVTSSLWRFTTLAPILIVAGAVAALALIAITDGRLSGVVIALIGLGITAYAAVRCFDVPNLGVTVVSPAGLVVGHPITHVEGGPFLELGGGLLLAIGALGNLWPSPAVEEAPENASRRDWGHEASPASPHAAR